MASSGIGALGKARGVAYVMVAHGKKIMSWLALKVKRYIDC